MKKIALIIAACLMPAPPAHAADMLEGYAPVDLADYTPREGPSALMLLQDLIEGHPEALGGKPQTKIEMKPTEDGKAIQIDVEMTGYLDDSVAGEQYRAIVIEGKTRGWKLERLGRKFMCGRGDNAGKWQTNLCP
jgi:hypothetical protein